MTNKEIAAKFSLLSKLMILYDENPFKSKAYDNASGQISRYRQPLEKAELDQLSIPGIGAAILKKIETLLETGELPLIQNYLNKTPEGVLEILSLKGIGAKKVKVLWQGSGITSLEALATACRQNKLVKIKGFGAKTQADILKSVIFRQETKDYALYAELEPIAQNVLEDIKTKFPKYKTHFSGAFRRQLPVLKHIDILTEIPIDDLKVYLKKNRHTITALEDRNITTKDNSGFIFKFLTVEQQNFAIQLFKTTNSSKFEAYFEKHYKVPETPASEAAIFGSNALHFLPPALRENEQFLKQTAGGYIPDLIQTEDIKGIIHCHSQYSDGQNTLEEMATAARDKGFEYILITDHSKAAFYANGLNIKDIQKQHEHIDKLNRQLKPFHIFKGIESDILSDGALDYPDEILASFDVVIASVHSNLKMDEKKAMKRLITAIENPYTTILGHPTGRLLLSRPGFPVNHKRFIDACVANNVVIEINANPRRLDLDWQWISYALEKGGLLSINPDAHSIDGMDLIKYGVLAAQKGGLTAQNNLSSKSLSECSIFIKSKK